jgi:hypothetical protein
MSTLGVLHDLGRGGAEQVGRQAGATGDHLQRVGQRLRLLEDFLLHVVAVVAEFDRVCRQAGLEAGPVGLAAVLADDANAVAGEFGNVAVLEVDHLARHLQQRSGVRTRIVAAFA